MSELRSSAPLEDVQQLKKIETDEYEKDIETQELGETSRACHEIIEGITDKNKTQNL